MQTVITYLAILFTGLFLQAQNSIEVKMNNFNNDKGKVYVGLYNTADAFLETEYKTLTATIVNQKAKVTFTDVPDGIYAISCFHDEDGDGELDMIMGMFPKEDYGCSNGAVGMFGPPKWDDAKFELKNAETKQINISL